ncbi:MAG: energy transducer TonB [Pseudomonadota bacterium]
MSRMSLWVALVALFLPGFVAAADEPALIETFVPPKRIKFNPPKFPHREYVRGQEGWAIVNFMVGPDGRTYDETVARASAAPFGRAALRATRSARYEPAKFDGRDIDASQVVRITFEIDGQVGARRQFIAHLKRFQRARDEGDVAAMEEQVRSLEANTNNLYESAFLNVSRYQMLERGDDDVAKLQALNEATYMDKGRGFLPDNFMTSMLLVRLQLELRLNYIGEARQSIATLRERELSPKQSDSIDRLEAAVNDYVDRDDVFSHRHQIDRDDRAYIPLERKAFSIDRVDGDVAELRLHCSRGYRGFIHKPETLYRLHNDEGSCLLQVIGTPGSSFTLTEHPAG